MFFRYITFTFRISLLSLLFFIPRVCHSNGLEPLTNALSLLKIKLFGLQKNLLYLSPKKELQVMHPYQPSAFTSSGSVKRKVFTDDCIKYAAENSKIPSKSANTLRILTYNIFGLKSALNTPNQTNIFNVIKNINPDVMILQEVWESQIDSVNTSFPDYNTQAIVIPINKLCNMMLIKKTISNVMTAKLFAECKKNLGKEERGFITATITLENKKILKIYGTHLDVWDTTEQRRIDEITELIDDANQGPEKKPEIKKIIITGDFNAVRRKDYDDATWSLVEKGYFDHAHTAIKTSALDNLMAHGFDDCFTHAHCIGPKFTVWTGTVVDFIFIKNKRSINNIY